MAFHLPLTSLTGCLTKCRHCLIVSDYVEIRSVVKEKKTNKLKSSRCQRFPCEQHLELEGSWLHQYAICSTLTSPPQPPLEATTKGSAEMVLDTLVPGVKLPADLLRIALISLSVMTQSVSVLLHVHTCPLTVACYPSTCLQLGYKGTNSMHGSLMASCACVPQVVGAQNCTAVDCKGESCSQPGSSHVERFGYKLCEVHSPPEISSFLCSPSKRSGKKDRARDP